MRRRTVTFSAIVLLAALGSGAAHAADYSGWIGSQGTRHDSWAPGGQASQLRVNLDAGLKATGWLMAPGDIDWNARVQYGMDRAKDGAGTRSGQNILTYAARLSLFDARESALGLRLEADRSQSDFSQSTPGVLPGTTTSNGATLSATTGGQGRPALAASGGWNESISSSPERPDYRRTTKNLGAVAKHGTESYSYRLDYRGMFEEASLATADYTSHSLGFNGATKISDTTDLTLSGQYFTRSPKSTDGPNPNIDDTQLTATSTSRFSAFSLLTQYAFGNFVLEIPGSPTKERFAHSLSANADRTLSREWGYGQSANVSYSHDRAGTVASSAAGQDVGSNVRWGRSAGERSFALSASARVGALEPAGGGTSLAWGTGASGQYARPSALGRLSLGYRFAYETNLSGARGWTLGQTVTADASSHVADGVSLNSSLNVDARRTHSPLLGDGASRTASFESRLGWQSRSVGVSAYLSDGLAGGLATVRGDALFLPSRFQTHTRNAALFASADIRERWTTYASVRFGSISAPDFPEAREVLAFARVGYRVGQLTFSAEERYTLLGRSFEMRLNEFMVRLTRTFTL